MKTLIYTFLAVGVLTLTALAGHDLAVADLPKEIVTSIEKLYPGAKLIKAEKELKKRGVVYEVKIEHDKKFRELDLTEDGTVLKDKIDH